MVVRRRLEIPERDIPPTGICPHRDVSSLYDAFAKAAILSIAMDNTNGTNESAPQTTPQHLRRVCFRMVRFHFHLCCSLCCKVRRVFANHRTASKTRLGHLYTDLSDFAQWRFNYYSVADYFAMLGPLGQVLRRFAKDGDNTQITRYSLQCSCNYPYE